MQPTNTTPTGDTSHAGVTLSYACDLGRLPEELRPLFMPLGLDEATREFIDAAVIGRHGRGLSLVHSALRHLMSDFDVNGLLGTYPLFLLGTAQWRALLGDGPRRALLDVGAGNGGVTRRLAPLVSQVETTETSRMMARRLRAAGFVCHRLDAAVEDVPGRFDLITCLNVIDRASRPASLLGRLAAALEPDGQLVLATPLPYAPFVYAGGSSRAPDERLPLRSAVWEHAVTELARRVLPPVGLELVRFTRAPYLSGGDPSAPLYVLDDVVLVCRSSRGAADV